MTRLEVCIETLSHAYHSRSGESRVALRDLNLQVTGPMLFGVLGPNGGGKSTLFRILATMLRPTSGRAQVGGFDVMEQAQEVRRQLGVVFQTNSLDRQLTILENLRCQGELQGLSPIELPTRIDEVLQQMDLLERRHDLVKELSGGLARRAELAKALLHRPSILLLDEPSTGLDPHARRRLWETIDLIRAARPMVVLLTTHLLDEADRCDRLILLHEGVKVREGTPAGLKAAIGGEVVLLKTRQPDRLMTALAAHSPVRLDDAVRVEVPAAHRFAADTVERYPELVQSVEFRRPTLEDVFFTATGVPL